MVALPASLSITHVAGINDSEWPIWHFVTLGLPERATILLLFMLRVPSYLGCFTQTSWAQLQTFLCWLLIRRPWVRSPGGRGSVRKSFFLSLGVNSCTHLFVPDPPLPPSPFVCTARTQMCSHVKDPIPTCCKRADLTVSGTVTKTRKLRTLREPNNCLRRRRNCGFLSCGKITETVT